MASIVSCPSCQRRLKIGTDKPGGKLRCPSCNTPFVLGSRTNTAAGGTPEFQAFELFEEHIVLDAFTIEEEPAPPSAPRSKPMLKSSVLKPKPVPAPPPRPAMKPPPPAPVLEPSAATGEDDLDLLHEGLGRSIPAQNPGAFLGPFPAPPPPPPAEEKPFLPDRVDLIDDEPYSRGQAVPPRLQPPSKPPTRSAPPAFSERAAHTSATPASFQIEPSVERRSSPSHPKSAPRVEPRPEAPLGGDFFLPVNFDPFAPPPKPALPDFNPDAFAASIPEPDAGRFAHDFDVLEPGRAAPRDGIAVVGGRSDAEAAEMMAANRNFEVVHNLDIADRAPRRVDRRGSLQDRREQARKQSLRAGKQARWAIVHWSLTIQLIGMAMAVAVAFLGAISIFIAIVGSLRLAAVFTFFMAAILVLRELLVLLSYGLGIPAPSKNKAWLWAVLAVIFSIPSIPAYIFSIVVPVLTLPISMTLILLGWFFYLLYLKSVGEALKIDYVVTESFDLMRLLGLTLGATILWSASIVGYLVLVGIPQDKADATGTAWVIGTCGIVFFIFLLIMAAVCMMKYWYIVSNLRLEIGWRLER